ncbi:MAG: flavodoxin-dependent (E)-4-hydroxy-3-methylbut-2-enyl-diphosphate synthase [Alphaproteobacteria bacterium]
MSAIRPWRQIQRRKTREIKVGNVVIGGTAPISVQSMTNTPTHDVNATVSQIHKLEAAGADLIRVSCPDEQSSKALPQILKEMSVPLVADIHFHYHRALEAADAGAHCLRINPGNIGSRDRVAEVVSAAKANGCAIRIGVNGGSLEKHLLEKYGEPCPEALVESALESVRLLEDLDFTNMKISVKASDLFMAVAAYHGLSDEVDYPLHLGITEAGPARTGTVKSSIGMGSLLWAGIGDTLRVSLSADPVEEIKVGFDLLKSLGLRHKGVNIISCPSCARQQFPVIEMVKALEERVAHITTPMDVSLIGCVVNGVGEAKETDIGLTGGGNGTHLLYVGGQAAEKTDTEGMINRMVELIEQKAQQLSGEPVS